MGIREAKQRISCNPLQFAVGARFTRLSVHGVVKNKMCERGYGYGLVGAQSGVTKPQSAGGFLASVTSVACWPQVQSLRAGEEDGLFAARMQSAAFAMFRTGLQIEQVKERCWYKFPQAPYPCQICRPILFGASKQ